MKKRGKIIFLVATLIFSLVVSLNVFAFEYVVCHNKDDCINCPSPTIPKPAKGVPFTDPCFNMVVTRVTDKSIDGYSGEGICVEYPKFDPENADGTYLLLKANNWELYNTKTFTRIKSLSFVEGACYDREPRWDPVNPNILYYRSGKRFYQYDVRDGSSTLLHDFAVEFPSTNYACVQNMDEGEPTADYRYWAFFVIDSSGKKVAIITYDKQEDKVVGTLNNPPNRDWVSMSPYGNRVVVPWVGLGNNEYDQAKSYALDFTNPINLGYPGHADLGVDSEGNDVLVQKSDSPDFLSMNNVITGKRTDLTVKPLTGDWSLDSGEHISGNNYDKPGWALVSTYAPESRKAGWTWNQVFMIELNPNKAYNSAEKPRIWRLAHTHSIMSEDWGPYWAQDMGAINKKGTKVWFCSNWDNAGSNQLDVYQVTLPETWWEDLGGETKTCSEAGGACKNKPCSNYETCSGVLGSCVAGYCCQGVCTNPTCTDGRKNQDETDIDCGGLTCQKCQIGKSCSLNSDCQSNNCRNKICEAPDTKAPVISSILANPSSTAAVITWQTDEPSNSVVKYGTSPGTYTKTASHVLYTTTHSITLNSLLESTTYYFIVNSTDQSSNSGQSSENHFTTLEIGEQKGLVAYYRFEEGSGIAAIDTSGNGNNGVITGATYTTDSASGGYALKFDGTNNYVSCSWPSSDYSGGMTVSLWIRSAGTNNCPIAAWPGTSGIGLYYDNRWYSGSSSAWYSVSAGRLNDNQWHIYVVTWNAGNLVSYRDGAHFASASAPNAVFPAGSLAIGRDNRGGNWFAGTIDEVRVYNRALSEDEIQALMDECNDNDGDGFNQSAADCGTADCNDADSGIFPLAVEICGNGIDENCDGSDLACQQQQGGGGSGGGGGGGATPKACNENWSCQWGPCQSLTKKWICRDLSWCNTTRSKPKDEGKTTSCFVESKCIDKDGDGYGEGEECLGEDIDDNNPTLNLKPGTETSQEPKIKLSLRESLYYGVLFILLVAILIVIIVLVKKIIMLRKMRSF